MIMGDLYAGAHIIYFAEETEFLKACKTRNGIKSNLNGLYHICRKMRTDLQLYE